MVCKIEPTLYVISHIQSCIITLFVHTSITNGVRMMICSQAFPHHSVVFDDV